jgi:hypothetical protein
MTLGEAKLSEMFKKVCLVDAFVYRSMQHVPFIFLNFGAVCHFLLFLCQFT